LLQAMQVAGATVAAAACRPVQSDGFVASRIRAEPSSKETDRCLPCFTRLMVDCEVPQATAMRDSVHPAATRACTA